MIIKNLNINPSQIRATHPLQIIRSTFLSVVCLLVLGLNAQEPAERINRLEAQLADLLKQQQQIKGQLETAKLEKVQDDLIKIGLPSENYIMHSALALEYAEEHEQAKWVAHIILPDIIEGNVGRTNDFRPDPLVKTGTAVEKDYFLKYPKGNGEFDYDGFGYDRGHLAPSADFRWSQRALSESYFYSNMSPQVAEFNREGWADLESLMRAYLYNNPETQLYVVTGGILADGLPVIERGVNKVSIPKQFFKVALDLKNGRGIGFVIPHAAIEYPLEYYAMSIDAVEQATGLNFFSKLNPQQEQFEASFNKDLWLSDAAKGDKLPIHPPKLAPGYFNTVQAKQKMGNGQTVKICGTVVSSRYSRSGNFWMNVDKQFPNQIFSVFIRKKDLVNFTYDLKKELVNQQVCFEGKVDDFNGTPTMNLDKETAILLNVPIKN